MRNEHAVTRTGRSTVRWVVSVLIWTLVAWGIWLVSLSAVSTQDLLVGGVCALACGAVAESVRRAVEGRWRPTADLLAVALVVPVAIVADAGSVLTAPLRRRTRGRLGRVPIGATGDGGRARARRALATAVTSLSPGTVVVDADPESGSLVIHSLAAAGPGLAGRFADRESSDGRRQAPPDGSGGGGAGGGGGGGDDRI